MTATKIVKVDPENPEDIYLREAAEIVKSGGLVIIPTETVYGIAANMQNKNTIKRLYEIKQRPQDRALSVHLTHKEAVHDFAAHIPVAAYKLIAKFWPGPLTLVLKAKHNGTIGLRMPDNKIAYKVIIMSGVPVVCPSANLSGRPSPTNFEEAIRDLEGRVDFAINAGSTKLKAESTVVDLTVDPPKLLREAAISQAEIEAVTKKKIILFVCTGNSCRSVMAKALLEKKLREQGRQDVEVLSAGIMLLGGLGATETTRALLASEGIDVSGHRSQRATRDMINMSDIILVMERLHEERILQISPEAKNRVFLLKEFAKISDNNLDIADPISRSEEFYASTLGTIKEAIERISKII